MSNILVAIELGDLPDLDIPDRSRTHRPDGGTPRSRIRNVYPYIWTNPHNPFSRQKLAKALIEGSATRHTRAAMANLAARNVVLAGDPPITPVPR